MIQCRRQILGRIQLVLKQKLNRALTCVSSGAHGDSMRENGFQQKKIRRFNNAVRSDQFPPPTR